MELIWLLILLSCLVKNGLPECYNLIPIVFVFGGESFMKFASEVFQSRMCDEFCEFLDRVLLIYIDNFIIHTKTRQEHLEALQAILTKCRAVNLHLRLEKCVLLQEEVRTLGFVIKHGEIRPDPVKIQMLQNAPVASNRKELRGFLGLLHFFRDMLPHLAFTCHKLYASTSDKVDFQWTEELNEAYLSAKSMLEKDIMSSTFDGFDDIFVYTDATKYGVCVVVNQRGRIIICVSKVLSPGQRKWSTIEREMFAISYACKKLRVFLHGVKFVVIFLFIFFFYDTTSKVCSYLTQMVSTSLAIFFCILFLYFVKLFMFCSNNASSFSLFQISGILPLKLLSKLFNDVTFVCVAN